MSKMAPCRDCRKPIKEGKSWRWNVEGRYCLACCSTSVEEAMREARKHHDWLKIR